MDSVAKSATEDPMGRPEMKCYTGSKKPDESSAEILALLLSLSRNVKDVMGNVQPQGRNKRQSKRSRESQRRNDFQDG